MASVNKVIIVGNLGRDPELRYNAQGKAICNITVATTESWKDKSSGEKKEVTEWHKIAFFDKLAETAGAYLKKGAPVYLEGRLQTRKYEDKQGVERYVTEIIADKMQMLGAKPADESEHRTPPQPASQRPAPASKPAPNFSDMDDDIPF